MDLLATNAASYNPLDAAGESIYQMSKEDNPLLPLEKSKKHGISSSIFEELLCSNQLGSRWIAYDKLKAFHEAYELDIPHEHAGIHMQEASVTA